MGCGWKKNKGKSSLKIGLLEAVSSQNHHHFSGEIFAVGFGEE